MPADDGRTDYEAYLDSLEEGFLLEDVNSTEDRLILTAVRGQTRRFFSIRPDEIERMTGLSGDTKQLSG